MTKSPFTFACCVEYGPLEDGVVRLASSIRRFGGRHADAPIVAVTPRRGPALRPATTRRLADLGVHYVRLAPRNRFSWLAYYNKLFALQEAENLFTDNLTVFLDTDVIIVREPDELVLHDDEDFAANARDQNIGVADPDDPNYAYWVAACRSVGLRIEDLPWVTTTTDAKRIRLYWNSGVFVYRPLTGFLAIWRDTIDRILNATGSCHRHNIFWVDQVALGLATVRLNLRFRNLTSGTNYGIASHFSEHVTPEGIATCSALHYHDSMRPELWPGLLRTINAGRPDVAEWLSQQGPVTSPTDWRQSMHRDALRAGRRVRRIAWQVSRTMADGRATS